MKKLIIIVLSILCITVCIVAVLYNLGVGEPQKNSDIASPSHTETINQWEETEETKELEEVENTADSSLSNFIDEIIFSEEQETCYFSYGGENFSVSMTQAQDIRPLLRESQWREISEDEYNTYVGENRIVENGFISIFITDTISFLYPECVVCTMEIINPDTDDATLENRFFTIDEDIYFEIEDAIINLKNSTK